MFEGWRDMNACTDHCSLSGLRSEASHRGARSSPNRKRNIPCSPIRNQDNNTPTEEASATLDVLTLWYFSSFFFFRQNSPQKRLQEEEEEECESLRKCRSSTRCNRTANVLTRGRGQALCERGVHERTQSDFVIIHPT